MAAKPEKVVDIILKTADGKSLVSAIGADAAKATLLDIVNHPPVQPALAAKNEAQVADLADILVKKEVTNIVNAGKTLQKLAIGLQNAKLAKSVSAKTLDLAKLALPGDSEAVKAAKWVCGASLTVKANPAEVTMVAKILEEAAKKSNILKFESVQALNKVLVAKAAKDYRPVVADQHITSSTAGQALIKMSLDAVAKKTPGNAGCAWDDLACYLLGSIIRGHGFVDGNGRTGRALYALSYLKGAVPFVAIDVPAEKSLHEIP